MKSCPFCRSSARIEYDPLEPSIGVVCTYCSCSLNGSDKTVQDATATWNTRASLWIKTSERLPEDYERVIVTNNHNIFSGLYMKKSNAVLIDTGDIIKLIGTIWPMKHITYWIPIELPEK